MKRIVSSIVTGLLVCLLSSIPVFAEDARQGSLDTKVIAQIVERQFPGARIREIELETKDGRQVYEVELVTADGHKKEMRINAVSGNIEKIEND